MAQLKGAAFNDWPWRFWAEQRPMATAMLREQQPISWWQLAAEINALSARFYRAGLREGDGIALRGKNSAALLLAYLAALQLGARVLPLNPALPPTLQVALLPALNIAFGWCATQEDWPGAIRPLAAFSPSTLLSQCDIDTDYRAFQRALTLTLTSGSSGLPKAAVHRAAAHLANADGLLQCLPFEAQDSWLLSLPLFHVSGQSIVWRWLLKGATLVQRNQRSLPTSLAGCTHASLVPTQLWRLLAQPSPSVALKQVLLGGATIPVALTEQAERAGIACWCGYGMTEMASTACAKPANATAGVGVPLPGRELRIVDNEIWLRGSGQALGYWRDGGIAPLSDAQGWFRTRDRGVMRDGELYIQGRLDNLFFSGGEGIQPEDIERVLVSHPQIEQAFVVPIDDAEFGQRPVAVIATVPGFESQQLTAWLEGKLAHFQFPDAYFLLPDALNTSGIKVSRFAVKQWVDEHIKR